MPADTLNPYASPVTRADGKQNTRKRPVLLRNFLIGVYSLLWMGPFSLAGAYVAEVSEQVGFVASGGEVLGWCVVGLGILFGLWTRRWRWLHWLAIPLGVVAAVPMFASYISYKQAAQAAQGGFLPGLGPAIAAMLCLWCGVALLMMAASGGVGLLIRRLFPRSPKPQQAKA